jgi:anaerobic selenocysteine-containing dehydrogenase
MSANEEVAYRTCSLCEATCGLEIRLEGETIISVRGDDDDVFSRGYICPKGAAIGKLHEDPDRLRKPLVKRGGEHVEVSWDEAFAAIEAGLTPLIERLGRSALGIYLGNPNVHNLAGTFYVRPLIKALGTKNVFSASTVDQMPKHVSSGMLFGDPNAMPVPDLDRTAHLLMLGANPFESNGSLCTAPDFPGRLKALRARGGKLVVVDPRRTRTAKHADEHHFIRPGTDALLLVAMLHTLFDEGLAVLGHVGDHVEGADAIQEAVQPFSPEAVAEVCGIDTETIRRMTRELAAAESAAVYGRIGTHTTAFGTLSSWAVDALNTLTGNLDRAGGAMFPLAAHSRTGKTAGGRGFTTGRWRSRVRELPEIRSELPVATLVDEMRTPGEGQVRALVTVAGNPALSVPDSDGIEETLSQLDFMVSVDVYLNETTRHADVILPPPSPLQRSHYDAAFYGIAVRNIANYSAPIFDADGPQESEILARLALVCAGQGAAADPKSIDDMLLRGLVESLVGSNRSPIHGRDAEEILAAVAHREPTDALLDVMLRTGPYGDGFQEGSDGLSVDRLEANPHGIDLGALEPRIPEVLSTPSAKIELAPPAILEDLVRLRERMQDGASRSLLLVGRRDVRSNNSWMHNLEPLVSGRNRCTLQLHAEDANRLGVSDGGAVHVTSAAGKLEVPAEIIDDIMPGVVSLPHGWGHDQEGTRMQVARGAAGTNSNRLTDGAPLDPLSGNAVLNGIPVQVTAVGAA